MLSFVIWAYLQILQQHRVALFSFAAFLCSLVRLPNRIWGVLCAAIPVFISVS